MKALTVFRAYQKAQARYTILQDNIRQFELDSNQYRRHGVSTKQYFCWVDEKARRHRQLIRFEQWLEATLDKPQPMPGLQEVLEYSISALQYVVKHGYEDYIDWQRRLDKAKALQEQVYT